MNFCAQKRVHQVVGCHVFVSARYGTCKMMKCHETRGPTTCSSNECICSLEDRHENEACTGVVAVE